MAIRTLSLIVADETRDAPVLRAAAAIARREGARLEVRCLGAWPVALDAVGARARALGQAPDAGLSAAERRAKQLGSWVRAALRGVGSPDVETVTSRLKDFGLALAPATRFCDLVIAGVPSGTPPLPRDLAILDALLLGSPQALLAVPTSHRDWSRPFDRVVVAWNGSPEAHRAVRGALPLLALGAHADIVLVDPSPLAPDRSDPGGALAQWLSRHGIEADIAVLARSPEGTGRTLVRFARSRGADALVMGGPRPHRRGGMGPTARSLLAEVDIPVLMSR